MNYEHKGIPISLCHDGTFSATIAGKFESRSSLAAIKKAIDKAAKTEFVPFTALRAPEWESKNRELRIVQVTGIERTQNRKYGALFQFRTDTGATYTSPLMCDTPENRSAYDDAQAWQAETKRIASERFQVQKALDALIAYHKVEDYTK